MKINKENQQRKSTGKFFEGIKFALGILFVFSIVGLVYSVGFHFPDEILSGTFNNNYSFSGTLNFSNANLFGINYNDLKQDSFNCPTNYSKVTGNFTLGTQDFCVMKYEAKNVGSVATSTAVGTPWVSIPWQQAKAECSKLGVGYQLITDEQWLTIANDVVLQSSNWYGGVIGTNFIWSGHNDNGPTNALAADSNDANGYSGTGQTTGSNQKRTLTLSTGDVIWDFSGNVWEWTDKIMPIEERYHGGASAWMTYDNDGTLTKANNVPYLMLPPNSWDADNGMGRYYDGANVNGAYCNTLGCTAGYNSKSAVFLRGGNWGAGAIAGAFALVLGDGPSDANAGYGFRCSYAP